MLHDCYWQNNVEKIFNFVFRYWSALRYASSLLRKTVDSLTPYATAVIVNGKSLCVGTIGVATETFQAPMTPKELNDAIFNKVGLGVKKISNFDRI